MLRTLTLLAGFVFASCLQAALPSAVDGQPLPSLAPMLETVTPAVVNVHTQTRVRVRSPFMNDPFFRRFFDLQAVPRERIAQSLGSGVVVDANRGLVLTNNHVVGEADQISVTLADGRSIDATLVGTDPDTDVAVLQLERTDGLAAVEIGQSEALAVGDFVVAVGNPFGLGQTVTSGIVSALGRTGLQGLSYQDFIQTDASINPGNSGGALVDLAGRLIGINTAIISNSGGSVGIGFAIPIDLAMQVMEQLATNGEVVRGRLGVTTQNVTAELAEALALGDRRGALVTRVVPEAPFAKAGLEPGDLIVAINDRPVRSSQELQNLEGLLPVDGVVELAYLRDGRQTTVEAEVWVPETAEIAGESLDRRLSGARFARVDEPMMQGLLVAAVARGSFAERYGFRTGDVLVSVNRQRVETIDELEQVVESVGARRPMLFNLQRRGRGLFLLVE